MAKFLIRTLAAENAHRYDIGDIVVVVPDTHIWGRYESKEVWVAEGLTPALWPDAFGILELTGLDPALAAQYLASNTVDGTVNTAMTRRRKMYVDIAAVQALLTNAMKKSWTDNRRITVAWSQNLANTIKIKL